ncbi:MAG TPA: 50S ribosomal protein L25 [Candidatus Vogelbacteria bacterium]|nr:50S ribosomal protein L25 [Candidatus Vogelbacteria bacterium]
MLVLEAQKRDIFGKRLKNKRKEGLMPVIVYGPREKKTGHFFVNLRDFEKIWKQAGESTIITLKTAEGNKEVLCYDIAHHPITGQALHADFYAVEKGKKVEVAVPLVFEGSSPAIKELGGTLVKVLHEINISALPKDLPHEIKVNIGSLVKLDSQITIADLNLPNGVEVLDEGAEVVAMISAEREEEPEEPSEDVDFSAIEVEKKGKKEEEGEKGGEETD